MSKVQYYEVNNEFYRWYYGMWYKKVKYGNGLTCWEFCKSPF